MVSHGKLLAAMRANPKGDWSMEQFKALARRRGVRWRQPGTSHVTFVFPGGQTLTVPSHKPIKPVYVRCFTALLEQTEENDVPASEE